MPRRAILRLCPKNFFTGPFSSPVLRSESKYFFSQGQIQNIGSRSESHFRFFVTGPLLHFEKYEYHIFKCETGIKICSLKKHFQNRVQVHQNGSSSESKKCFLRIRVQTNGSCSESGSRVGPSPNVLFVSPCLKIRFQFRVRFWTRTRDSPDAAILIGLDSYRARC